MNVGLVNVRRNHTESPQARVARAHSLYVHVFKQYMTGSLGNRQTSEWQMEQWNSPII